MAPKKSTTAAKMASPPPVLLSNAQRRWYKLGLVAALISFVVGGLGLLILLDANEKKNWYTNTAFASFWMKITDINPMVTAVTFNGGGIYSFILYARLRADNKARRDAAGPQKKKL